MAERPDDLCASFKRHLRTEGKAERTQALYGMSVDMFSACLAARGRPATVDELTRPDTRKWLADLAETREASTVRTRWKCSMTSN